jgi:nuclear pore complex protein Nup155
VADIAELIASWLVDASPQHAQSNTPAFPATEVDTAIGKYLMALGTVPNGAEGTVGKLQDLQREIRRKF